MSHKQDLTTLIKKCRFNAFTKHLLYSTETSSVSSAMRSYPILLAFFPLFPFLFPVQLFYLVLIEDESSLFSCLVLTL